MRPIDWCVLDEAARTAALARPPRARDDALRATVQEILAGVRCRGDAAVREFTARFDRVGIDAPGVGAREFDAAEASLDPAVKAAIGEAAGRIETFHRACMQAPVSVRTAPGVRLRQVARAIGRVGLYVPAGSAPLPSTVLMLAVPARLAGCDEVVLCSPPRPDGSCDAAVLYAARFCGVHRVFKVGGAQAIAAMAWGTEVVPRCDKVFGPGNAFVTEAKLQVAADPAGVAIDLPAGPSEAMVVADAEADPAFVAADLLSQAEHGPDSQVLLVSDATGLIERVALEVAQQLATLPRAATARQALSHCRLIKVGSIGQAFEVANRYAPEHLLVQVRHADRWLGTIRNAGAIFLGPWTPESLGDYCSGSNHVLPTGGWARSASGVSVASFEKRITVQECSAGGLRQIGPCAATLAAAERLEAHRRAVTVRLAALATRAAATPPGARSA